MMEHHPDVIMNPSAKKKPKLIMPIDDDDNGCTSRDEADDDGLNRDNNQCDNTVPSPPSSSPPPSSGIETRKCELCLGDHPRSCYSKKQWNKTYGGWNCQDCNANQRAQLRTDQQELTQQNKQNRHTQKISDQAAKQMGAFMTERRCITCQQTKLRTEYSGKQWKQLFRECQGCTQARLEFNRNGNGNGNGNSDNHKNVVDRLCSGCHEIKHRPDFSPKQWKNPQDADRLCKECWAEEELAKEDHRLRIEAEEISPHPGSSSSSSVVEKKRCFACHKFKVKLVDFSGKQQKKTYGICIPCVIIVQGARHRQKTVRICSSCQGKKGLGDYAREQWKKPKGRCRTCAAAHVHEQEEHRQAELMQQQNRKKDDVPVRKCLACKEFQNENGFSARQWTKTYATCKTCSSSMMGGTEQDGTALMEISLQPEM